MPDVWMPYRQILSARGIGIAREALERNLNWERAQLMITEKIF